MEKHNKEDVEYSIGCSLMTLFIIFVIVGMIMWKCEVSYNRLPSKHEFKVEIMRK